MNTAYVEWSLGIECPSCNQEFDLANCDEDGEIAKSIFSNNWDRLIGRQVECIYCNNKFKIGKVEY